jgi:hypothetical protein
MARPRKAKVKTSVYESDEIKAIVEELVPQFHGTLKGARFWCGVETREDIASEKVIEPRAQDWRKWGRVEVANKVDLEVEHWHFRLILQGNAWERMNDEQKIASVDWLLAACEMRDGRPRKSPADVHEVRTGVYRRRGAFNRELEILAAAVKGKKEPPAPGTLDLEDAPTKAAKAEAPAQDAEKLAKALGTPVKSEKKTAAAKNRAAARADLKHLT